MPRINGIGTVQEEDRTGSPISIGTCNSCHNAGGLDPEISIELKDLEGVPVTEYEDGETYVFEVHVSEPTLNHYGFQAVALIDSDDSMAGNLTDSTSNVKFVYIDGTKYMEHNGVSSTGTFIMKWTPPAIGSGRVAFYASGIAANNDESSDGDRGVKADPLFIEESPNNPVSLNKYTKEVFSVYPNPTVGLLYMTMDFDQANVLITDLSGKVVYHQNNVANHTFIDVSFLCSGTYNVVVSSDNQRREKQIIKL